MNKTLVAVCYITFAVVIIIVTASAAAAASASPIHVTVTADTTKDRSDPAPSDFVSFSVEVPCFPQYAYLNKTSRSLRPSFINLMKFLGGVSSSGAKGPNVRIGGNSADETWYCAKGSSSPSCKPPTNKGYRNVVDDVDIDSYSSATKLWNGTVTPGYSMRSPDNHTNSAEYVVSILKRVPSHLLQLLESGNEVDLFGENKIRPHNYSFAEYDVEFGQYFHAIQGAVKKSGFTNHPLMKNIQGAVFATSRWDPDLFTKYLPQWAVAGSRNDALGSISQHEYCGPGKKITVDKILSPKCVDNLLGFAPLAALCKKYNIKFVNGECNSAYDGGGEMSRSFAATIWSTDYLLTLLSVHASRANFHGCPRGYYQPISIPSSGALKDIAIASNLFYGMWFSTFVLSHGARIVEHKTSPACLFGMCGSAKFWTLVSDEAREVRFVAIAKDPKPTAQNISVTFSFSLPFSFSSSSSSSSSAPRIQGKLYRLEVPDLVKAKADASDIFKSEDQEHPVYFGGQTLHGSKTGQVLGKQVFETVVATQKKGSSGGGPFETELMILPPASAFVVVFGSS